MAEYQNFTRRDLGDGLVVCEDVHLPSGAVCTVYFSRTGIYVLSCGHSSPRQRYHEIKQLLSTIRLRLYLLDSGDGITGLYEPGTDSVREPLDSEALTADVNAWLDDGYAAYSASSTERMISHLKNADFQARGYMVQDNGDILLLHNGEVRKASPVSSEQQYYLTLFTGPLGFHRFALGKFMSGFLYFCTGGLFMVGWLLDLIQLFFGIQKDRKKRYLMPLKNRKTKLIILPLGLLVGFLLFLCYLKISDLFGAGLFNLIAS